MGENKQKKIVKKQRKIGNQSDKGQDIVSNTSVRIKNKEKNCLQREVVQKSY